MAQATPVKHWTASEILATLETYRPKLKEFGVRKLGLFGSYRRGTATPESDMDFLVEFEQPTFDAYMDTKFFLEDLFHRRIDLVQEKSIKPRLRPYLMNEVIYVPGL